MDEIKRGNYVGKEIGDFVIIGKNKVNNRQKYLVRCLVCCVEKWTFNPNNLKHGTYCEGKKRKTGSKKIGQLYGDYIVVDKTIRNGRSSYIVKCTVCNSVKEVYNLREEYHSEHCNNFLKYILGEIIGDYIINKSYREDRVYVDVECLKCGAKRSHVAYKDFKSQSNNHSKICTIKNVSKFGNKELVRKLLRTYANINIRIKKEKAYENVKNNFIDSVDFVTYVYDMYIERLNEGNSLRSLSIDRINPFGNYEKGNVRCLTISEQQYNKRIHYKESVEAIENSVGDE